MGRGTVPAPCLLHAIPGRLRIHLPGWSAGACRRLEGELCRLQGVRDARVNSLTGNILIEFEPRLLSQQELLGVLRSLGPLAAGDAGMGPRGHRVPVGDDGAALRPGDLLGCPARPGRFGSGWPRPSFTPAPPIQVVAPVTRIRPRPALPPTPAPPDRRQATPPFNVRSLLRSTADLLQRLTALEKVLRLLLERDVARLVVHVAARAGLSLFGVRDPLRRLPGWAVIEVGLRVIGVLGKVLSASPLTMALGGVEAFLLLADGLAWYTAVSG